MTKRAQVVANIAGATCVLILLAILAAFYVLFYSDWLGGMRPGYAATNYDARLTREAATASPLFIALHANNKKHAAFPLHAADLASYLPAAQYAIDKDPEILGWCYWQSQNGSGYELVRSVGRDTMLRYRFDGSQATCIFDPGDGSAERHILLKP